MTAEGTSTVRLRVHFNQRHFVRIGKVELLEHIMRTGSLIHRDISFQAPVQVG